MEGGWRVICNKLSFFYKPTRNETFFFWLKKHQMKMQKIVHIFLFLCAGMIFKLQLLLFIAQFLVFYLKGRKFCFSFTKKNKFCALWHAKFELIEGEEKTVFFRFLARQKVRVLWGHERVNDH